MGRESTSPPTSLYDVNMVATFSPHHDSGGTLHLPSPSQLHSADPAALMQLRRSLSRSPRSPSKAPTYCIIPSKPGSPIPSSPLSPSPPSPRLRHMHGTSPLAVPYPRSVRKGRVIARRMSPMRTTSRQLSAQRSPAKRALSDCSDRGNATPSPPRLIGLGIENDQLEGTKPLPSTQLDDTMEVSATLPDPAMNPPNRRFGRQNRQGILGDNSAKSSPLKRSDASASFDLARGGSPSAKRRSLHGASLGADFNIFDQAGSQTNSDESFVASDLEPPSFASPIPRRNASLRKAALQQRHDKPLRLRNGLDGGTDATPNPARSRPRMSLDSYPQPARESPFSSQGSLPSASAHPLPSRREAIGVSLQIVPPRHPLSRTVTQSSSGSSFTEESPTVTSLHQSAARRANLDFTRSLPLHASRPALPPVESQPSSQETQFATPESYKLAKPLPQAFMSTGLISKRNKNIEQEQLDARESIGHMPDTPCKRPFSMTTVSPNPLRLGPARNNRHTMHSFGTPSTPFNPHVSQNGGAVEQGTSVFGSTYRGTPMPRRGSFLAADLHPLRASVSPLASQSEIPPTPTKTTNALPQTYSVETRPVNDIPRGSITCGQVSDGLPKSTFEASSDEENDGTDHCGPSASPSERARPPSLSATKADGTGLTLRGPLRSPTPQSKFYTIPPSRRRSTRPQALPPGVPNSVFENKLADGPQTPAEMLPPDPSRLSISAHNPAPNFWASTSGSYSGFVPVTPTANRDSFRRSTHKPSLTPIQQVQAAQVDESITSRFDKVELIGLGEFSSVFRGVQLLDPAKHGALIGSEQVSDKPRTKSWAVKKTRHAYLGQRDRNQKLKEVEVLRALGRSDHTIEFVDSWEFNQHLYIQTEYCDEGGLDVFLENVGRKARLDDFRIWKILLELSQGLQHIHESGIIHLDLKPANVLITFEGVLKIGDFGMATFLPAAAGIDGEGDREYIAPEILRGIFDKPADVFALGLIMLEIAGNVELPDNGLSWQRLRGGDMSDVPSLTSTSLDSQISRDSSGQPVTETHDFDSFLDFSESSQVPLTGTTSWLAAKTPRSHRHARAGELLVPPPFMTDPLHHDALDRLVRWMISPEPSDRPSAAQLLGTVGVQWVQARHRAGATIYEGNWGPADEVLQDDAEMIDV